MRGESTREHYQTLGLEPGAAFADVKRAYRELAKTWHPDRVPRAPHLQQQALEKFQAINHAYAMLCRQQFARRMAVPSCKPEPSAAAAHMAGQTPRQRLRLQALPAWLGAPLAPVVPRLCAPPIVPLLSLTLP